MFGWLSGKPKSNLPEPTAIQVQRTRQIEQLKSFKLNVTEIHRDVEYRVNTLVNGTTISLIISLPPQFPQEKPVVTVTPPISHPWVNDQMVIVGSPGLNNFLVHSDLGKEIRGVLEEFTRNPPTMLPQQNFGGYPGHQFGAPVTSANLPSTVAPSPATYGYSGATNQLPAYRPGVPTSTYLHTTAYSGPPNYGMPTIDTIASAHSKVSLSSALPGVYKMPDLPTTFTSQLQHLSLMELQEFLENEDKLLQIVGSLPQLQKIATDREHMTDLNEKLANTNLARKPQLEERKKILLEQYDRFNDVKQQYDNYAEKQDLLRKRYEPRVIQDRLKVAAQQAEEESEAIAENFLDGKIPLDEFQKKYMDKRKLSHLRTAKMERLAQSHGGIF